jgi:hypothetical protein
MVQLMGTYKPHTISLGVVERGVVWGGLLETSLPAVDLKGVEASQ